MDPVARGPAALFEWLWPSFEVIEWYALEDGSPALRAAVERLLQSLIPLEHAFCERARPDRRGPLLAWALQHAARLEPLLQAEAGDPSHPIDAFRQLRAAFGALEDLLEIEALRPPRRPASGDP